MGKTLGADGFAEMGDGLGVAEKILKAHGLRIVHFGKQTSGWTQATRRLLRPKIPKHQRREENSRFVRVSHDIPISEYPLCFLDQILNPVSVELIGEVVIGIVPFFLQTNEAARHRCEVRWNRTWYKRSKTSG
jgi:hypothetical protein